MGWEAHEEDNVFGNGCRALELPGNAEFMPVMEFFTSI